MFVCLLLCNPPPPQHQHHTGELWCCAGVASIQLWVRAKGPVPNLHQAAPCYAFLLFLVTSKSVSPDCVKHWVIGCHLYKWIYSIESRYDYTYGQVKLYQVKFNYCYCCNALHLFEIKNGCHIKENSLLWLIECDDCFHSLFSFKVRNCSTEVM